MTDEHPANSKILIEQYKAYMGDLGNLGTRFTTMNGFYLSILSVLLTVLGLSRMGGAFEPLGALLNIIIPLFAVLLCWIWRATMLYFSTLFGVKFRILREMEEQLAFPIFKREEELLSKTRFIDRQLKIPLLLLTPFALALIYGLWTAAMMWSR